MTWKARNDLYKSLEREIGSFESSEVEALEARLRLAGVNGAKSYLHAMRSGAIPLIQLRWRSRRKGLSEFAEDQRLLVRWAVLAWTARALVLIEKLDRRQAELDGPHWSGSTALNFVDDFEAEEVWLWPFKSDGPFLATDDDEEADYDN